MRSRTQAAIGSIGFVVAVGAVTAVVTVGVIVGIRHFNEPPTTTATSHVPPESDPTAEIASPTSEECTRVRELHRELIAQGVAEFIFDRAGSDSQSTSSSNRDGEPADRALVLSDEELRVTDACHRATEAACARLYDLAITLSAATDKAIADCSAACEIYPHAACGPPCVSGLFGFGDLSDEDAPGGCTEPPICDSTNDWRLIQGDTSSGHPWDLRPPGWVPPTPECVPICDIDRDGLATARDYAGECAEVAAWLAHDCETQSAGLRVVGDPPVSDETFKKYSEMLGRLIALCHDADLAGMATLPPTLWQNAWILHQPSAAVADVLPEPPNIDLLTRYRCAGRLTDPCIDYSR